MRDTSRYSSLRVLVVDDCPDMTGTLAMLLEVWGHAVTVANDGLTALESVRASRPDVLISDIALPRLSGWDLARRVRGLAGMEHALLVAISGFAHDDDMSNSRQAGFDVHLVKPVDPEHLYQLLLSRSAELGPNCREMAEHGPCGRL